MDESYELMLFKNFEEDEYFEELINNMYKLHSTFIHFDKIERETVEVVRLASILKSIELDNTNDQQLKAFNILGFLIKDIQQFIVDMFIEETAHDVNYFYDSFKDNITMFENTLNQTDYW